MARVSQVIITLAPDGSLVAEFPTPNGLRRHVPITSLSSIHRILGAQLTNRPQTIGTDAKPTQHQTRHWEQHLDRGISDDMCPWCMAAELGIDTSRRAYNRARAMLLAERKQTARRNFHYAGDGSVKVYTQGRTGKAKPKPNLNMTALLLEEEDEDDD